VKAIEKPNTRRSVSSLTEKLVVAIFEKCNYSNTFIIPCITNNDIFNNTMLDIRASINSMFLSVFTLLVHLNPQVNHSVG